MDEDALRFKGDNSTMGVFFTNESGRINVFHRKKLSHKDDWKPLGDLWNVLFLPEVIRSKHLVSLFLLDFPNPYRLLRHSVSPMHIAVFLNEMLLRFCTDFHLNLYEKARNFIILFDDLQKHGNLEKAKITLISIIFKVNWTEHLLHFCNTFCCFRQGS